MCSVSSSSEVGVALSDVLMNRRAWAVGRLGMASVLVGAIVHITEFSIDVHPKAIQEILGHANITTTPNIYGHLPPKVLRSATDRMGALAPDQETDETL
jgi:integrase